MLFLFFIFNLVFVYFFYFVGFFYLSFLPLFLCFFIFFKSLSSDSFKNFWKEKFLPVFKDNFFLISWALIIGGFLWIFEYLINIGIVPLLLGDSLIFWLFIVFFFNLLFLILSFLLDYKDGKKIFHFGLFLSVLLFFARFFVLWKRTNMFDIFIIFWSFFSWFYAFVYFVLWIFKTELKKLWYMLYVFWVGLFILSLYLFFDLSFTLWISLAFFVLFLLFLFQYLIKRLRIYYQKKIPDKTEKKEEIIDSILYNKEKTFEKRNKIYDFFSWLDDYFDNLPYLTKLFISLLNIIFIIFQIFIFFLSISYWSWASLEGVFYWFSIVFFILNFILLKFINYPFSVNRFFVFLILNFWVYLSIINIFGDSLFYLAVIGVIWNFFNSMFIFFSRFLFNKYILWVKDYYFWIFFNFVAMLFNIYFISQLWYDYWFLASSIVFYIWIQFFFFLYNINFVKKLEEEKLAYL